MPHRILQHTIVYAAFVVPYSNELGPEYSPFCAVWAHHFLAILCKLNEFVRNSVFNPASARFVIFAKSCVPIAKMTCTLLKIAKKGCAQCENDKTCWSRAENAVLYKLVHFTENAKKWCAQCENDKTSWCRAQNSDLEKLVHLAENR